MRPEKASKNPVVKTGFSIIMIVLSMPALLLPEEESRPILADECRMITASISEAL